MLNSQTLSARLRSPSVARNREPILEVLAPLCAAQAGSSGADERRAVRVLELASGSGEHAVHFASRLPSVIWQPSDLELDGLASIDAWRLAESAGNVLPPLCLDATHPWRFPWSFPSGGAALFDGLVCINMVHISPWQATLGLFDNAARVLAQGAFVLLYGPYRREGRHTAESNARFDAELRVRNPAWGVRALEDVVAVAEARGFALQQIVEMPRDNLCVVLTHVRPPGEPVAAPPEPGGR